MTLLFHADESSDGQHYFFGGVLADGHAAAAIERGIAGVVTSAFVSGYCAFGAEIHAEHIVNHHKAWSSLTLTQGIEVLDGVFHVLDSVDAAVFGRGIDLQRLPAYSTSAHTIAFRNTLERINEYLDQRDQYAIVIADTNNKHAVEMRVELRNGQRFSTPGYRSQQLARVLGTVHFVDSSDNACVQMADAVMYVIRRRSRGTPEKEPLLESAMRRWWDIIQSRIPAPQSTNLSVWAPTP